MALNYGSSNALSFAGAFATAANNAVHSSAAVTTSTTNNIVDTMVRVQCTLTTPGSPNQVVVYVYGSEDGTNFASNSGTSDDVDGTAKALTALQSPTNMRLLGVMSTMVASSTTYKSQPMSIAAAFGGTMPRKWGIVVQNTTGAAFTAASGSYTEIYYN